MRSLPGTPIDRLLTAMLLIGPVLYLVADALYATRGWDDPAAGVVHVLGAAGYAFVLLRLVTWSDGMPAAVLLVVGVLGVAGNVAYGFDTIHVSLGDTDLVDATGAAAGLIKPLGLCFPLTLLVAAFALRRRQPGWVVAVLAVAGVAWPVAHIANVGWLAVLVNAVLVATFGAIALAAGRRTPVTDHPLTQPA
ncbi:hypothetical protein AB0C12_28175 [Actinoplanes sp. NPDC048967]|uniref:hypothetical protein n=1 Tax=Actinoplanes sp. NPDC048967 TaxID=3155269 RepID=UPI0033FC56A1